MTFLRKKNESLKSASYGNDLTVTPVTPYKIQYSDVWRVQKAQPGSKVNTLLLNTQPKVRLSPYWNCKGKHWEGNYFGTVKTM